MEKHKPETNFIKVKKGNKTITKTEITIKTEIRFCRKNAGLMPSILSIDNFPEIVNIPKLKEA